MSRTSDSRYGRRGGRFESGPVVDRADTFMAEVHHARIAGIAAGTWPENTDQAWHDRAEQARHTGATTGAASRALDTSRALTAAGRKATT